MNAPKSRKEISVVVATHVALSGNTEIFGTSHSLIRYVVHQGYKHFIIKHDLQHDRLPLVETNQRKIFKPCDARFFSRLSFFGDMLSNLFIISRFGKIDLFIGVDPVNALTGLFFRFLGRAKTVVYYSVDYTPNRFGVYVLDFLYRVLDMFCALHANEVWSVSKRLHGLRLRQNLGNSKNVYMPNSPEHGSFKIYPPNEIKKHSVVIVANLSESLAFELLIEAMKRVKEQVPDVRLDVIGDGFAHRYFVDLVEQNHLDETIFFLGYLNHNKLECELGKYAVGLAIYSGKSSWNYYGDSTKAREYLAAGIPVILNSIPSTSADVKNTGSGEVVPLNAEALASSIVSFLTQSNKWNKCRLNAIHLSKEFDKKMMLDNAFKRLVGS